MRLKLECLEGPRKGDQFTIREEVTVGRKAELALRDKKASAEHAKIQINSEGLPELVDLGSSNGTRVNGETITQKLLQVGDLIQIGHTTLKVLEVLGGGGAESNEPEFDASLEGWARTLEKLLLKNRGTEEKPHPPKPFSPPVKLIFRTGTLVGKSLLVGFGPRSIGAESTDILIREPDFEGEAFSLIPQESGEVLFSTTKPEKVLINKQSTKESPLKDGDLIQVGPNVIEVSIKKKSSSL